jgi:SAM-dependent methyltransferase
LASYGETKTIKPRLRCPPDRTIEQLENHFRVESAIAARLKQANRGERVRIYRTMYDDLFSKVPDHPRLVRRRDAARTAAVNLVKLRLLRRFLDNATVAVELGAGDCRFSYELCRRTGFVYGVDISDQRSAFDDVPENFEHVVYDGYDLPLAKNSVDIFFSDQLIEHLHPEDLALHFQLVLGILKDGGVYVFRTPHRFSGPHDISMYFRDEACGFHLKEWTYRELLPIVRGIGYRSMRGYRGIKGRPIRMPIWSLMLVESVLGSLPGSARRSLAYRLSPEICMAVAK